jgi:hypothetical protein
MFLQYFSLTIFFPMYVKASYVTTACVYAGMFTGSNL